MQKQSERKDTSRKLLHISVVCSGNPIFSDIDPRITHDGRWLESLPPQAPCQIPTHAAGEIIEKLVNHSDVDWVNFSNVNLSAARSEFPMYAVSSITFQKLIELQSGQLLNDFDVNTGDSQGNTLLHWATACLDVEMIKKLLNSGAKDDIQNNMTETPTDYAKYYSSDQETRDIFTQWSEIKSNTQTDRINTLLTFQGLVQDNSNPLPHIPDEIVRMIGENQTPSFGN